MEKARYPQSRPETMSNLEHIEDEIRNMSPDELARFRNWFLEFDSRKWDEQIEQDAQSGKLDKVASPRAKDDIRQAVAAMRALPRIKGVDAADIQRAGGKTYEPSE